MAGKCVNAGEGAGFLPCSLCTLGSSASPARCHYPANEQVHWSGCLTRQSAGSHFPVSLAGRSRGMRLARLQAVFLAFGGAPYRAVKVLGVEGSHSPQSLQYFPTLLHPMRFPKLSRLLSTQQMAQEQLVLPPLQAHMLRSRADLQNGRAAAHLIYSMHSKPIMHALHSR